jgi:hypothetical protein
MTSIVSSGEFFNRIFIFEQLYILFLRFLLCA